MNRAVLLGLALATTLTASAAAQSPWPDPKPQTGPWPSAPSQSAPAQTAPAPRQAPGQAAASPWPSSSPPAQSSPWPSSAPAQQSAFPSGGGGAVFGAPPQAAPPGQCNAFPKLRDDAAHKADLVSEIGKKHGERAAMCAAVTRFFEAEQRVVKFLEDNKGPCGVPDQAVQQARIIHTNTQKFKDQVCAEGPKPKIPTLSDAIGTTPVDTPKNTKTGPGTFNTLTGNPLGN